MNRRALIMAGGVAMVTVAMPAVVKAAPIALALGSVTGDDGLASYLRFLRSATPGQL